MCTVVILHRPESDWPLILAANRDEMRDRPWRRPGRHWPDRPHVLAGQDTLAQGSWLGINDDGLVAVILNREGTLGPAANRRSRGELVLEALDHADAREAADALAHLNPQAWRPFNLLVADNRDVFWLRHCRDDGSEPVTVHRIPAGLSMLAAHDRNDPASPRIRVHRPHFAALSPPAPPDQGWEAWAQALGSAEQDPALASEVAPHSAMCFQLPSGFGTVCSSLLALPAAGLGVGPVWRFAAGPPDRTSWEWVCR